MNEQLPKAFDLIWLDGGHEFPEVAWDHFYSMQRLNDGGWLFSDDIIMPDRDHWWNSVNLDPHKVVNYYNERQPGTFDFLLKREDPLSYVKRRKFIAFHRKPS